MLLKVILTYLELLLPLALMLWGIGIVLYAIVGTAIGIGRSIPIISLVVFLVCVFLLLS